MRLDRTIPRVRRSRGCGRLAIASLVAWLAASPAGAGMRHLDGATLDIPTAAPSGPRRPVSVEDLMALRDMKGLAVSPDGRFAVTLVNQADVAADSYRIAWFLAPLDGRGVPVNLGDAGEPGLFKEDFGPDGRRGQNFGGIARWSPDGRSVAYLRSLHGEIQVWRTELATRRQEQLTFSAADVLGFAWNAAGDRILYTVGESREGLRASWEADGRDGYLVTPATNWSMRELRPIGTPLGSRTTPDYRSAGLFQGDDRPATVAERAAYQAATAVEPVLAANSPVSGRRAVLVLKTPGQQFDPPRKIELSRAGEARAAICSGPLCEGSFLPVAIPGGRAGARAWWDRTGQRLLALRLEGENAPGFRLVSVDAASGRARAVAGGDDLVSDCTALPARLICLQQTTAYPRRIVEIDLDTGVLKVLFDPNPQWRSVQLGETSWIRWADAEGHETYGVLVKPIGYQAGRRYPLVIAGYATSNALRGDYAARYPVQALAANGFVGLVYDLWQADGGRHLPDRIAKRYSHQVEGARVPFQQLSAIVAQLAREGLVDPDRVGIGGHSDGLNPVAYGLIHSDLFKAVSVGWLRWNDSNYFLPQEPFHDELRAAGLLRDPRAADSDITRHLSVSANAAKIRAPILVHASDSEFELLNQIEPLWRLSDAKRPVEMYVYPDERHVFFHPAHRDSEYRRNIQWFSFWLRGEAPTEPLDPGQPARWQALRQLYGALPRTDADAPSDRTPGL